ncbi:MAG: hypothetical protein RBG1_1C00001G1796 [candidate division Zixibacteria bacterium RBG-1]|nr:MAG: hypothetical protein RBG1_1C00001G1796 [candidate division Zixibacteria bacterium RBG-1]OGC86686.1 MAG: hypothetical protein A2V73_04825 [candidate division Zixibacteria bacterium RBG_19FT_COMBO_42_43]
MKKKQIVNPLNPTTNKLGSGVLLADVQAAVAKSGYPLQTIIADSLKNDFRTQQEWSYIDRDTKELRTLDIFAEKWLFEIQDVNQYRIRPTLDLLIECKHSELPFVFFLSQSKPWSRDFPLLAGLSSTSLTLTTDDDASSYVFSIINALGLDQHKFIIEDVDYCMSFSKCVRKGKNLELSGDDPFQKLVLPLLKSMHHFRSAQTPSKTAFYFDCHLVFGIGVLDAPMVGVRVFDKSNELILLPWVRVLRHESYDDEHWTARSKLFAIDIVHKDFFNDYLNNHLMPYARDFAKFVFKHEQIIATGQGFAKSLGSTGSWNLEPRLEPKRLKDKVSRTKIITKNILRLLIKRKRLD